MEENYNYRGTPTRAERREQTKLNRQKMGTSGRSVKLLQALATNRAEVLEKKHQEDRSGGSVR